MLEVHDVSKAYKEVLALDHISFGAPSGQITGCLGPNGAGKTTMISILLGLSQANSGEALLNGQPIGAVKDVHATVGAVLGGESLHPGLKVSRTLEVQCAVTEVGPAIIPELLKKVDLEDAVNRRVNHLSLGMKQRLALAVALTADPEILLLDEPANGLDPQGMHWLRDYLRELADRGKTIFLCSHLLSELELMADRVVVINHGRLLRESSLEEWHDEAENIVQVSSNDELALKKTIQGLGGQVVNDDGGLLKVKGVHAEALGVAAHQANLALRHLSETQQSLEQL